MQFERIGTHEVSTKRTVGTVGGIARAVEPDFQAVAESAAAVCTTPISFVSLIDGEDLWVKATVGTNLQSLPRATSFCEHAIASCSLLEIPDTLADPFWRDNIYVETLGTRFFAGMPVILTNGSVVGSICVIDREPKVLSETARKTLINLALVTARLIELRHALKESTAEAQVLSESVDQLRQVAENAPVGIFCANAKLEWIYANRALLEIVQRDPSDLKAHRWRRYVHADDIQEVARVTEKAVAEGLAFDIYFRVGRPSGSVRQVRMHATPVFDAQGKVETFVGTIDDLTGYVALLNRLSAREDHLRRLYEATPVMMHSIDAKGQIVAVSNLWLEKLGYRREEVIGRSPRDFMTPESAAGLDRDIKPAIEGDGTVNDLELHMVHKSGNVIEARLSAIRDELDADPRETRILAVLEDITVRHRAERALRDQHELLRVTMESIADAVISTDAEGAIRWLNPVAERMTGWSAAEAFGKPLTTVFRLREEGSSSGCVDSTCACLANGSAIALPDTTILLARDGATYGIEATAAPIRGGDGGSLGIVIVFRDVTEERRISSEMRYRASHDPLTGLLNRTEFEQRLRRALQHAQESDVMHALVYIDLDRFKPVNDTWGHAVGDIVLQDVASVFRRSVRDADTIARIGGDEFAVLLEHCTPAQARLVAEAVCKEINDRRFEHNGCRFGIGASIGVVAIDGRWASIDEAVHAADLACYSAKEAGRGRVYVAPEPAL